MALSAYSEYNETSGLRKYFVDTVADLPTGSTVHNGDTAEDLSPVAGTTSSWWYNGTNWVPRGIWPTYNAAGTQATSQVNIAKVSFTLTQVKAAATNKVSTLAVITTPANAVVTGLRVKHSTAFTGGGESACTLQLGVTGTIAAFMTAVDIFTAVGALVFYQTLATPAVSSAGDAIIATITTTTNNVSGLTAGGVDIWIEYIVLP